MSSHLRLLAAGILSLDMTLRTLWLRLPATLPRWPAPTSGVRCLHSSIGEASRAETPGGPGRVPAAIWARVGSNLHTREGHPLCILREAVQEYFERRERGRFEFQNDLHPVVSAHDCFDSLLVPKDHVSRAPTDTYYVDDEHLLRAHMTAHDVRLLQKGYTAFINCGDVYRRDTVDRTHYPVFHQVDAVKLFDQGVPENVIVDDLKDSLAGLAKHLFGPESNLRWVDAYFPFTHPSFELEVQWQGEWLELLGCGQIQRSVLRNGNVADDVSGWAFGIGLERVAMVLFSIPDIRLFWSEDARFLDQFKSGSLSTQYKPFSVYPSVKKDVSFWVDDPSAFHVNDIHELVRLIAGDLVETVELVDTFSRNGRESLCFRITFRSMERNLTHVEINSMFNQFREKLAAKLPVALR